MTSSYGAVLARNIRSARARLGLEQEPVAERMRALGFDSWRRQTVASVEKTTRRLTAEEVIGLALALETSLYKLVLPEQHESPELPSGIPLSPKVLRQLFVYGGRQGLEWNGDIPQFPKEASGGSWRIRHKPSAPELDDDPQLSPRNRLILETAMKALAEAEKRFPPGGDDYDDLLYDASEDE